MKCILLPIVALFLLTTSCSPAKYQKNGSPCPPISYGIPECTDLIQSPELDRAPSDPSSNKKSTPNKKAGISG